MSKRVICAMAAGAALSVLGTGTASADPVADGRTSCGTYNADLARAQQTQIDDAYATRAAQRHYQDTLYGAYSMQDSSDAYVAWANASDAYRRAKAATERARTAADRADC